MYSHYFIAKHNLKKHKGEVAILFVLIYLAALLLFCSLSLMLSGNGAIKENDEKYHVSDLVIFTTPEIEKDLDNAIQKIENLPGTQMVDSIPVANYVGDYYYGSNPKEDAVSYQFFLADSSCPTYLNAFPEEYKDLKDDEIVLPYFLKGTIKTGESFHILTGGTDHAFTVKGYLEHLFFATPMNVTGYYCIISHNVFEDIASTINPELVGTFINCKVKEGVDIDTYDKEVQHLFDGMTTPVTVARPLMETATLATANIASAIVLLFTLVLVGLAVIIMYFSIKNFIELNIQNIGLLQANGYTAKELRRACILEEMLICVVATILALATGFLITTPLNSLEGMLMGLSGFSGVCIPALIATLISIPLLVFLGTLIASRSYKKLTVLESLRSGISNHNFKKNRFALDRSSLPMNLALSGKQIFGKPKKSIFIALIIALLTFASLQGFTIYQNFALNQDHLLKLVGFEAADVQCDCSIHPEVVSELQNDPRVERILLQNGYMNIEVKSATKNVSLGVDVYDDLEALQYEFLLEGHLPQNGNEIVLTTVNMDKLDVKIGDVVTVISPKSGEPVSYTVCGIDQKINNMGNKALMSSEGAARFNPEHKFSTCMVYLKDGTSVKDFQREWNSRYPMDSFLLVDDLIGSTIDTLVMAMSAICFIFIALTCFVVILTEILLTRSQIIRERSELGVSKAIGYTSGELVRRMIMSTLPIVVIGVLTGFVLQILLNDTMMSIGLSSFGIAKSNLTMNPIWFLVTAAIIITCATVTSFLNSRSISKLDPVRILKEE
ncbi:MAG: FtsX-like permease family protein [Clostridiales bacterium]|nr:FtsX-like permease family protein [Clostridiales bacterium]